LNTIQNRTPLRWLSICRKWAVKVHSSFVHAARMELKMSLINSPLASLEVLVQNKKVLFITTKNLDYIRNTQEIELLKGSSKALTILGYKNAQYLMRLLKLYARLLFMPLKQFDVVFVGFAPQLIILLFIWKFKGITIVEDFFISLYDTLVFDRKKFKEGSFIAKLLFWIDKITINRADYVITDTQAHGQYFINEFKVEPSKVNVLYLEADHKIYLPIKKQKPELWNNKFVVLYFGSILPLQGIDTILECIKLMKDNDNIIFDIIGPIPKMLLQKYDGLNNVYFTKWLSQQQLAEHIAAADLCLAGHFNENIAKAARTIPGKAFIYNAMAKPMILGDNVANRERFTEDNIMNFYVEMGDTEKLKNKILYAMKNCI
jgi:glycosyltransferase involved in cell wall biosynthesis